jgi:hypothetical protein
LECTDLEEILVKDRILTNECECHFISVFMKYIKVALCHDGLIVIFQVSIK